MTVKLGDHGPPCGTCGASTTVTAWAGAPGSMKVRYTCTVGHTWVEPPSTAFGGFAPSLRERVSRNLVYVVLLVAVVVLTVQVTLSVAEHLDPNPRPIEVYYCSSPQDCERMTDTVET